MDRFHDNRIIGPLFEVDLPNGWHLVNVWDGLPIRIIEKDNKRWAFADIELPDPTCVFVAMPEHILVQKDQEAWNVKVPDHTEGYLKLVGMDTERRPVYDKEVPVAEGLRIDSGEIEANVNGYVMVQYLTEGVVRDVKVIRIDP